MAGGRTSEDVDLLIRLMGGAERSLPPVERAALGARHPRRDREQAPDLPSWRASWSPWPARTGATRSRYEASVGGRDPVLNRSTTAFEQSASPSSSGS